jgi:adenylate cyclase class 2
MKETEVKILEINREKIEESLIDLNAEKIFSGNIQTLFFDFKDRKISKQGNLLRLRTCAQKTKLTYKKVKHTKTVKLAEEYSVEISNMEAMVQILNNLGLTITGNLEKQRLSYKVGSARFDIDKYTGNYAFVPEFLEIEAETVDQIHKLAGLLGFNPKDCLPWSTKELIQHYSNQRGKAEK